MFPKFLYVFLGNEFFLFLKQLTSWKCSSCSWGFSEIYVNEANKIFHSFFIMYTSMNLRNFFKFFLTMFLTLFNKSIRLKSSHESSLEVNNLVWSIELPLSLNFWQNIDGDWIRPINWTILKIVLPSRIRTKLVQCNCTQWASSNVQFPETN